MQMINRQFSKESNVLKMTSDLLMNVCALFWYYLTWLQLMTQMTLVYWLTEWSFWFCKLQQHWISSSLSWRLQVWQAVFRVNVNDAGYWSSNIRYASGVCYWSPKPKDTGQVSALVHVHCMPTLFWTIWITHHCYMFKLSLRRTSTLNLSQIRNFS